MSDLNSVEDSGMEAPEAVSSWTDSLSEDLRSNPNIAKFKDVESLAKSYVSAQKMIGGSVKIPGEGATDREIAEFYGKLGRPESFDKYTLPELSTGETAEDLKDVLERMHKANFTDAQVKEVLGIHNERHSKMMEYLEQKAEADKEAVKGMWGADFEKNSTLAKKAAEALIEQHGDAAKEIFSSPLANNPVLLSLIAEIGKNMSEGNSKIIAEKDVSAVSSKEEIQKQIDELKATEAYRKPTHRGYVEAGKKYVELYRQLHSSN